MAVRPACPTSQPLHAKARPRALSCIKVAEALFRLDSPSTSLSLSLSLSLSPFPPSPSWAAAVARMTFLLLRRTPQEVMGTYFQAAARLPSWVGGPMGLPGHVGGGGIECLAGLGMIGALSSITSLRARSHLSDLYCWF